MYNCITVHTTKPTFALRCAGCQHTTVTLISLSMLKLTLDNMPLRRTRQMFLVDKYQCLCSQETEGSKTEYSVLSELRLARSLVPIVHDYVIPRATAHISIVFISQQSHGLHNRVVPHIANFAINCFLK